MLRKLRTNELRDLIECGVLSVNEARCLFCLPSVDGGDEPTVLTNEGVLPIRELDSLEQKIVENFPETGKSILKSIPGMRG